MPRAVILYDEVDATDVDAELEAARADDGAQVALLEPLLRRYPARLRQRAVVDADREIRVPEVEAARKHLARAARVREDEGRLVLLDESPYSA